MSFIDIMQEKHKIMCALYMNPYRLPLRLYAALEEKTAHTIESLLN